MIKLFRNIRKKLLAKDPPAGRAGKTTNYFKYAIGEIVLVMIGILLALQVTNWDTNRLNKIEEASILYQLQEEYNGKLDELNQKVAIRNLMIEGTRKILENINQENYIGQINSYCIAANIQSEDIRLHIESVLELINSELKTKS